MSDDSGYSEIANEQFNEIEASDAKIYNDILTICEFILESPARAQSLSSALATPEGIRFRLSVPEHHPYKVFWSSNVPRIEAVSPYP